MKTIALHKTFENGTVNLYLHDDTGARCLDTPEDIHNFITTISQDTSLRMSSAFALDVIVREVSERGVNVLRAYWHDLGLEKGLSPEEIAKALYMAPASVFRSFKYHVKLAELRTEIAIRSAKEQAVGDTKRRILCIAKNEGLATPEQVKAEPRFNDAYTYLEALSGSVSKPKQLKNGKVQFVDIDTVVNNLAKDIPECRLFNEIAGLKGGYITAATLMSIIQDIDRFPNVASLWSYFGMSVVDGKAPKRKAGSPANWSSKGRTCLYNLGVSIVKNTNNPWRQYFEDAKDIYLAKHAEECKLGEKGEPCKFPKGHADAQARRKMVKEILKRFYLKLKGEEYKAFEAAA